MPVEDSKQSARRFYEEVINARNVDALGELLIPDGVDHTFGSQNTEQAKQFFGMVLQAFPDLHAKVHDVIAEGDLVAARVTYTGTHQGEFVGIPATGRKATTSGVCWFRMEGGKQAEHWGGPDMLSFLQQLGGMSGRGDQDHAVGHHRARLLRADRLDEFVATRLVEVQVHGMDLTDALGAPLPSMPRVTTMAAEVLDEVLARAASGSHGGSLVLPPRPGWRDLAGRLAVCWHATVSTVPGSKGRADRPARHQETGMRQFEQDWLELGRRMACSLHHQHPRNLRLLQAAQAELRWATATTTRATSSSSQ